MARFGFVMEQTLGHVTHHQNLARSVEARPEIEPHWVPVRMEGADIWQRMPLVRGNWSLTASLRARDGLCRELRSGGLDALLFHTQTTALFSIGLMRRIPAIVSLDATPMNYDAVGQAYGHKPDSRGFVAARKRAWSRAIFAAAAHLVTWCEWAKQSLISDYGVGESRISVIPPGVDVVLWGAARGGPKLGGSEKLRLLFVGGDFRRKGGHVLLEAFRGALQGQCELDIVTRDSEAAAASALLPGVRVHTSLTPNCAALRELFSRADLFVFPTLADCLPIAVMEAMAAGLPVIATAVGALGEQVEHGVNGLVVPPGSAEAIVAAVRELRSDETRAAMSRSGTEIARTRFDATRNYAALLDLMADVAGAPAVRR
jgi:glycosyltransferase involved in cell wall biosynthesis